MTDKDDGKWCVEEEESKVLDLEMLRDDLVTELQAINQYQDHIYMLDDEEAQEVLSTIVSDEKDHVALLVKQILKLDPTQEYKFHELGL